jgi:hypothetical protein
LAFCVKGNAISSLRVLTGVSQKAKITDVVWEKETSMLLITFDDPLAKKDEDILITWESGIDLPDLLFAVKGLSIVEVTHWSNSSRVRLAGGKFEARLDFPLSGLEINVPHEGPFYIACGRE